MDKRDLSILYSIYETSLDGLLVVNSDREIIDYNSKFLEIWGITADEMENITSERLINLVKSRVKNQVEFSEKINKLYSGEDEISRDELFLVNGKIIDRYSVPWKQKDGEILGRLWFFRDISKLKTIEKEKLENEANFNAMVENTPAMIWSVNKSYELISFNSTFKKIYLDITGEYPRQKKNIFSSRLIPADVVRQWKDYYDRALAGERFNVNIDSGLGDETTHQYYSFSPIINDKGQINGVSVFNYDITELVRNRRELEKNRFLLNRSQKISKLGGWEVDLKTREITWTEQVYKIHEVDENFKAKVEDGLKFYHPKDRPKIEKAFNLAATEGEPYDLELRFITAKNKLIWVRALGEPVFSDTGEIIKVTGVFQDITEQKLNREALERSEERYRLIAESVADMISRHTPEGDYTYASPSSRQLLGYHPDELTGKSAYEFFHPDDLAEIKKSHETIIETPLIYTIEYRIKRRNGKYIWVETTSKTIRDGDNNITSIIAVTRNINDRKLNEEKLTKLRERLELATKTGHIGIWDWDIENDNLIWDDSMFEIYGADKSDFEKLYKNWTEQLHPDDSTRMFKEIELALSGEKEYNTEFRIIRPDGNTRFVKGIAQVKRDASGKPERMTGVNIDITERKLEEERLRNTLSLLQTTFDSIKEGVIAFDSSGNVTSYNSRFVKMFTDSRGRSFNVSSLKLNDMFDCLLQQSMTPDELIEEIQFEMKADSYKINKKLFLENGKVFDLLVVPQMTDGIYKGTVWSFNDVTDISEATEKMISYANDMETAKLELEEKTRELERSREILRGVAFSVSMLIEAADYKIILPKVFETLAKYTGVDRIYLYKKINQDGEKEPLSLDYLWNDENVHLNNSFPKLNPGEFKPLFPDWE
jgi:PAS domain S-box-containing protein